MKTSWGYGVLLLWAAQAGAVEFPAELGWTQRVELALPVSGTVKTVNAAVGDRVKKGQILLQLDDTAFAGRAEEASAEVARREAEEADAKRDFGRVKELYDRAVISTSELEQAKLKYDTAHAQSQSARARHKQDGKSLSDTRLRAPFDGLIVARSVEPGQVVAAGLQPATLFALARAGEMVAHAQVPESGLEHLKLGQELEVTVANRRYRGTVSAIGVEPVRRDKDGAALYALDVRIATGQDALRAGGKASVVVP